MKVKEEKNGAIQTVEVDDELKTFRQWLRENGYSDFSGARKRCSFHGLRESGVYNYRRFEYECWHCLLTDWRDMATAAIKKATGKE